jgi:hypothetical protein
MNRYKPHCFYKFGILLVMESGGKEANVMGGTVGQALPSVVLMGGVLDEGVRDGTDADMAQDFVESGGKEANVRGGIVADA